MIHTSNFNNWYRTIYVFLQKIGAEVLVVSSSGESNEYWSINSLHEGPKKETYSFLPWYILHLMTRVHRSAETQWPRDCLSELATKHSRNSTPTNLLHPGGEMLRRGLRNLLLYFRRFPWSGECSRCHIHLLFRYLLNIYSFLHFLINYIMKCMMKFCCR